MILNAPGPQQMKAVLAGNTGKVALNLSEMSLVSQCRRCLVENTQ